MKASQRWGSLRGILKFGKSVTKTVPAFRVVWTVPMTAFWYSKNLESRSKILEATWSPFLSWKVSASLIAPKWRCVYPCFCHGITNSLGRARVMKFSFSLVGILNQSNLETWTYSFTVEGWEGPIIFLWVFLNEDWGLLNTVYGFTIGKSVLGILLSSGTWEISYK